MNQELYHHGVKGMKWGVRRYQDKSGRLTSAGKKHLKDQRINKKIEGYIKAGKAKVKDLEDYDVGLITMTAPTGEKYLSGLRNGSDFSWLEVTSTLDKGLIPPSTLLKDDPDLARISDDESIAAHANGSLSFRDMVTCNPGFGKPGTTQNCAKCSAALELKMRGYDISAGRQSYPSSADAQSFWFKGAQRVDYSTIDAEKALNSYGPNTSGTLSFLYPNNKGGHAVHWTNDSKGNFEIQDGQNGRKFNTLMDMIGTYGGDPNGYITTFRLDNCEPNWDNMASDSVIRFTETVTGDPTSNLIKNRFSGAVAGKW